MFFILLDLRILLPLRLLFLDGQLLGGGIGRADVDHREQAENERLHKSREKVEVDR